MIVLASNSHCAKLIAPWIPEESKESITRNEIFELVYASDDPRRGAGYIGKLSEVDPQEEVENLLKYTNSTYIEHE